MPTGQWFYTRNGQQQGPVPLDELRGLGTRGELTAQDLVWTETMANWQPAHTVPGLVAGGPPVPPATGTSAGQLAQQVPPSSAVPSAYQSGPFTGIFPQVNYPPGGGDPPFPPAADVGQDPGMRWVLPVGRSGWAIAAGYLGLFSVLLIPAPLALITGVLALRDIRRNPQRHGKGRAVFGIVMGVLFTALGLFALFTVLGARSGATR